MIDDINDSMILTKRFRSPVEFSLYIEERVLKERIGYIDVILDYCKNHDLDVETVGKLITKSLKEKIQIEAEESNLMKPRGRLPL
jgi:hypothetical protein